MEFPCTQIKIYFYFKNTLCILLIKYENLSEIHLSSKCLPPSLQFIKRLKIFAIFLQKFACVPIQNFFIVHNYTNAHITTYLAKKITQKRKKYALNMP